MSIQSIQRTSFSQHIMKRLTLGLLAAIGVASTSQIQAVIFNFANGTEGWTAAILVPNDNVNNPFVHSGGVWSTAGNEDFPSTPLGTEITLTSGAISISTTGSYEITINHSYHFENTLDGGILEYNINGGAWSQSNLTFTQNGYNDTISNGGAPIGNTLNNLSAWTGGNGSALVSKATLTGLNSGDSLQLRFRGGWDYSEIGGTPDWSISQVEVAVAVPEPHEYAMVAGVGLLGFAVFRRIRARKSAV